MIIWTIDTPMEVDVHRMSTLAREIEGDYVRCIMKPDKIMVDVRGFGKLLFDCLRINYSNLPSVGFIKTRSGIRVVEDLAKCGCGKDEACHLCPDTPKDVCVCGGCDNCPQ